MVAPACCVQRSGADGVLGGVGGGAGRGPGDQQPRVPVRAPALSPGGDTGAGGISVVRFREPCP